MFPCKSSILRLFLVEDWLLEYFYVYMLWMLENLLYGRVLMVTLVF